MWDVVIWFNQNMAQQYNTGNTLNVFISIKAYSESYLICLLSISHETRGHCQRVKENKKTAHGVRVKKG